MTIITLDCSAFSYAIDFLFPICCLKSHTHYKIKVRNILYWEVRFLVEITNILRLSQKLLCRNDNTPCHSEGAI